MARSERVTSRLPGKSKPPPATLVVLVRHGTTTTTGKVLPGRAPGLELSEDGRRQAKAAAARVAAFRGNPEGDKDKGPDPVVYASPLERAQQTAEPIAAALGVEVRTDDGLADLDTGDWTGLELKTASKRKEWSTIQRYPSGFRFPGGESFVEMQARMVSTIDRLCTEHPGRMVVLVSHADPIRSVVAHAMGAHLDMFQRVFVAPCSITAIAYGKDGPMVLAVNATDDGRAENPT